MNTKRYIKEVATLPTTRENHTKSYTFLDICNIKDSDIIFSFIYIRGKRKVCGYAVTYKDIAVPITFNTLYSVSDVLARQEMTKDSIINRYKELNLI